MSASRDEDFDLELAELAAKADAARALRADLPTEPPLPPTLGEALPYRGGVTAARPRWCAICGGEAEPGHTYCDGCRNRALDDQRSAILYEAQKSIPDAFRWCSYTSILDKEIVSRPHAVGLYRSREVITTLFGPKGRGKTSLACAYLRHLLDAASPRDAPADLVARAAGARFVSIFDLAYLRAEAELGREPRELHTYKSATVLVVDDLCAEPRVHNNPLAEILHKRFNRSLTTIVTCGFGEAEITERYGDGVYRRLTDRALVIQLLGGHMRIAHDYDAGIGEVIPDEGRKADDGKPRYDLLPFEALESVARVLAYGARKYGDDNWRAVPNWRRRYLAAGLRHIAAYARGEAADPDTGESHLAHATCCLLFMIAKEAERALRRIR